MPPVLAIEPDPAQAEVLRRSVQARIKAELLVVATTDDAMKAIGRGIPDLILVSALLSPRDEDRLFDHLRSLSGASHLQTLTIPQLRRGRETSRKGALGRFRKKTAEATPSGCDPAVF